MGLAALAEPRSVIHCVVDRVREENVMTAAELDDIAGASNPRAARSKAALIDAMTNALDTNEPGTGLSLSEISRAAGVSRPTLYQHFGDLPNLIRAAAMVRLVALFKSVPQPVADGKSPSVSTTALRALLTELEHRRGFYLAVLDSAASREVRDDVIGFLATRIMDVTALGKAMHEVESTDEDVYERAMFLAAGVLWRTERWLRDEQAESAEQLAQRLSRLLASSVGIPEA